MKTQNAYTIVLDLTGPDDEDQDLRALTSADIDEDDMPRYRPVDEFSNEFLMQAPRSAQGADAGFSVCRRQHKRGQTL